MRMPRLSFALCLLALVACAGGQSGISEMPLPTSESHEASLTAYRTIFRFSNNATGLQPGGLRPYKGVLYGTTEVGGLQHCLRGCGLIFSLTTSGVEKVLYRFQGGSAGSGPGVAASLTEMNGYLFGTTLTGGTYGSCLGAPGCGVVYGIRPDGTDYHVLYRFPGGAGGAFAYTGLLASGGLLYGVTQFGGSGTSACGLQCGVLYSVTPSGDESVLLDFTGGTSAVSPYGVPTMVDGTLYGVTSSGGDPNTECCGVVFKLSEKSRAIVLHRFVQNYAQPVDPEADLKYSGGLFYGTSQLGGYTRTCPSYDGCGTVFSVTLTGAVQIIHKFAGGSDGAQPLAGITFLNGAAYGTTSVGGSTGCSNHVGCGTVFQIKNNIETVIYRFKGGSDGAYPETNLVAIGGVLYGTTEGGGGTGCGGAGCGTVFALIP